MLKTIVIGSLNTDLVATGLTRFPKPGEHVYGKQLLIGPGGKSRNIAEMMGNLAEPNTVAMIGITVKDQYGLWKPPLDALSKVHVSTDHVTILDQKDPNQLPGIAIIAVDQSGNNQIVALPGVTNDFSVSDIDRAASLFQEVAQENGYLISTLECPPETALYAIRKAKGLGIKVLLDPGGILENSDSSDLLKSGLYLLKPNEHEAKILTGLDVTNFDSAEQAARKLQAYGIENVMITHGEHGAYLFTPDSKLHVPIPTIPTTDEIDATGCGDQTMATLCSELQSGKSLEEAAKLAVLAGTLQFHRHGIKPVTRGKL